MFIKCDPCNRKIKVNKDFYKSIHLMIMELQRLAHKGWEILVDKPSFEYEWNMGFLCSVCKRKREQQQSNDKPKYPKMLTELVVEACNDFDKEKARKIAQLLEDNERLNYLGIFEYFKKQVATLTKEYFDKLLTD